MHNSKVVSCNEFVYFLQMLELYDKISFENTDGGTWKQGWTITYNEAQWSDDAKLRVFVVPHSHNDPGCVITTYVLYDSNLDDQN